MTGNVANRAQGTRAGARQAVLQRLRLGAAAVAMFAAACAHDVHGLERRPAPALDVDAARAALTAVLADPQCGNCIKDSAAMCARRHDFPLVAAVSGARVVKDFTTCRHVRPPRTPEDTVTCGHFTSLGFDAVAALSRASADADDLFRETYTHAYWRPHLFDGVSLSAGERYLVFAHPFGSGAPRADWDIGMACRY